MAGAQNLADPVGSAGKERDLGQFGHPLPPRACQIGHENVRPEIQFRRVDDPPPARPAAAAVEGHADLAAQPGPGLGRTGRRTRAEAERAFDQLGDLVFRRVEQVLTGGGAWGPWALVVHGGPHLGPP